MGNPVSDPFRSEKKGEAEPFIRILKDGEVIQAMIQVMKEYEKPR